jgi:hypothetical protein
VTPCSNEEVAMPVRAAPPAGFAEFMEYDQQSFLWLDVRGPDQRVCIRATFIAGVSIAP